jgi:hypothetical protein
MKTLKDCYKQNLPDFQKRVESATTISELSEIVQDRLTQLGDIDGEYIGSLTQSQARIALSMLEAFRLSFSMLAKNQTQVNVSPEVTPEPHESIDDEQNKLFDGVWGGLAGGALGGTIVGGIFGGSLGAVLGAFVSTVVMKSRQFNKSSLDSQPNESQVKPVESEQAVANIDKEELLLYLEQTLNVIDQTVAEYGRLSEPAIHKPKLEDHLEVLEFLQDFIGETEQFESQLPEVFKLRKRQLSSILRKYGIRHQSYQNNASEQVKELFDFEPSIDPDLQSYVMEKPAFLKDDQILLHGKVIEPSPSNLR